LEPYGVTQFTLMALARNPRNGARSPIPLSKATVGEWRARYAERGYFNSDVVTHSAIHRSSPFTWDDLDLKRLSGTARTVFHEGREAMQVANSLVIPIHNANGFAGFVSLFFADSTPPHASLRRSLEIVAIYALEKAKDLHGLQPDHAGWDQPCELTARQREALAFMAQGKTDWEIGKILGISEKTANNHLDAVKRKLGVATRAQAVARAVHSGWIAI
jgi:DNA-binding CsgD family transcriptional regulator